MSVALIVLVSACSGNKPKKSDSTTQPNLSGSVNIAKTDVGKILVDSKGMTLYGSIKDVPDLSTCYGDCTETWPPHSGDFTVGKGLGLLNLKNILRTDGISQLVYNGHPLYLYTGDKKAGDINGHNVSGFFAITSEGEFVATK